LRNKKTKEKILERVGWGGRQIDKLKNGDLKYQSQKLKRGECRELRITRLGIGGKGKGKSERCKDRRMK